MPNLDVVKEISEGGEGLRESSRRLVAARAKVKLVTTGDQAKVLKLSTELESIEKDVGKALKRLEQAIGRAGQLIHVGPEETP